MDELEHYYTTVGYASEHWLECDRPGCPWYVEVGSETLRDLVTRAHQHEETHR